MNTTENNKRIAKNTLLLYVRMFFIMAITLFTSRVVLSTLGVQNYGIYNVVGGVVAMLVVLNSSMAVSTQRYLTYEIGKKNTVRLKQIFSMCFSIYILISLILVVVCETVGLWFVNTQLVIPTSRMYAANWVYQFSILACVNSLLMTPYDAVIIANERMNIYAYISIIEVSLKLCVVYLLYIINMDRLVVYSALIFIASFIVTMIYRIYCLRNFEEANYSFYWNKSLFKELLSYSGWNLFGSVSGIAKDHIVNILLNIFFNPIVNASRGIAMQVNTAISMFYNNFYTAVRPQITKYYAQGDMDDMLKLVFRSSKFSLYLILLLSLPILIETPYIINLWLGQLPQYVVPFCRLMVFISAVDAISIPLMTTAHATGHIRLYQFSVGTMNIMIAPFSYFVLKIGFSPVSVFIVSLIVAIICLFIRLWIVHRLVDFPVVLFVKNVIGKAFLVGSLSSVLPILLHLNWHEGFWAFIFTTCLCIITTLATIIIFGVTKGERIYIETSIRNQFKK